MSLFLLFNLKTHLMKKSILFLSMLLFLSLISKAQTINQQILYETPDSQINLYIVSQGFTTNSMSIFNSYVDGYLQYMFGGNGNSGIAPYSNPVTKSRFRIIRVQVPSTAEHLPAAYFQFDHLPLSSLPPYISVQSNSPEYQQYTTTECISNYYQRMDNLKLQLTGFDSKSYILGVFNNNYYTGGGGKYCFTSIFAPEGANANPFMYKILLHEFSHTFGILADEYSLFPSTPVQKNPDCSVLLVNGSPVQYNPTAFPLFNDRNVTPYIHVNTPSLIPWKNFINASNPGVGTFDGANYSSTTSPANSTNPVTMHWFRSEQDCIMRSVSLGYCKVCLDLVNERIEEHLCKADNTVTDNFILRHQYLTHWRKASNSLTSTSSIGNEISVKFISGNSVQLSDGFSAVPGSDFLANIGDCSNIELINQYRFASGSDTTCPHIEKLPDTNFTENKMQIIPNPSSSLITISANNYLINNIIVYSIDGKMMYEQKVEKEQQYTLDISNYSKGMYIVTIETSLCNVISEKIIKN